MPLRNRIMHYWRGGNLYPACVNSFADWQRLPWKTRRRTNSDSTTDRMRVTCDVCRVRMLRPSAPMEILSEFSTGKR